MLTHRLILGVECRSLDICKASEQSKLRSYGLLQNEFLKVIEAGSRKECIMREFKGALILCYEV